MSTTVLGTNRARQTVIVEMPEFLHNTLFEFGAALLGRESPTDEECLDAALKFIAVTESAIRNRNAPVTVAGNYTLRVKRTEIYTVDVETGQEGAV